jgi:hypothetical protein
MIHNQTLESEGNKRSVTGHIWVVTANKLLTWKYLTDSESYRPQHVSG